jgi:uncharacterized tellurite resistance protein B-like protein
MNKNYQLGLLCFTHLLVSADGVVDEHEMDALRIIKHNEKISDETFDAFESTIKIKREKDIYQCGIEFINQCTDAEKIKVFVTLYKLSEVDGRVHVKEIRLLLYSIKLARIEFNDVVNQAMASPALI